MQQGVARIPSVEGRTPPPGDYTSWDEFMADVEAVDDVRAADRFAVTVAAAAADRAADYERNHLTGLRVSKAMRLAPNAIVFAALLEGQPVPHSAMDPEWLRRYA